VIALRVLVAAVGVALGVFYPFISVILAGRGFTPGEIGFVFSIGALGFSVAVPVWGHIADVRLGRPLTLQLCAAAATACVIGSWLATPALLIVVLLIGFWVFESSWQPLVDAITVNALEGRDYARIRLFGSLGFAGASVGAGLVYDTLGYGASAMLLAAGAALMAASAAFVPDVARADLEAHRRATTRASSGPGGVRARIGLGSTGVAFRIAPQLWLVLLASTLLHVGVIGGYTFLPLRIDDLGGSPTDIALSAGLSAIFEVPAMLVMGSLARRVGLRAIFIGATLLYAACMASWMLIEVPIVIVATRAFTGLAFSGVVVGVVLTIGAILPADLQATGQSLFQTSAFGVAAILANLLGGLLYETIGPQVFGVGAILALLAAAIGWIAFPSRRA
jgi:PPP family 3-phenylpropionic acid transporter